MKYSVFGVFFGTVLAAIHDFSRVRIIESVTLPTGACAVMIFVPMYEPRPMTFPGTLYSLSWSIAGLTRMSWKNLLRRPMIDGPEAVDHFVPKNTVKTWT